MRTLKAVGTINLLALSLLGLLFVTLDAWAGQAGRPHREVQAPLCVNPGGTDGCHASIQAAIDAATDGDTVRVVEGTFSETVVITKSVTLQGGWKADFTVRDWEAYVTTIDARRNGPVVWVNAPVTPTIDGFVITGGDDTDHLGWGGGIKLYWSGSTESAGLTTIRHNVITNNVACRRTSCQGQGGGIMAYRTTAIIAHNTIVSNVARLDGDGGGQGGGVMVGWLGEATLTGNAILSNTAAYTPTGLASGQGGGVYVYSDGSTLTDNEIRGNVAAVGGVGRGGGVHVGGALYHNRILSNTASVNGDGYGGGVYAEYVTYFEDNVVQGNVASQSGDGTGGGVWGQYFSRAYRNTIVDNLATRGGGIYYTAYPGKLILRDNLISRNRTTGTTSVPPDGGGGVASAADKVEIVNNHILSNTASGGAGGGVLFTGGTGYLLQDNRVISNTALAGGGVAVYTSTGTLSRNQVISNRALFGGGVYVWGTAQPALDANVVLSNTASGLFASGAGVMVNVDSGLVVSLTNHVIARNAAGSGGPGGGVLCWQGDCVLINNTIVDNDRGDYKEGVYLASSGGTHTLWNNVIVGHSTGVDLVTGAATLDYNDYYDNDADVLGTTWGPHHRSDDPLFQDRAGADYHLALSSPLVDQGDGSVAPARDYEGDPRPRGGGVDIGADEAYPAEVYVSANVGSDLTGSGTPTEPFASVTRALTEVSTSGTVYVARGHYTERVTVTRGVALQGGYRETDWSRDVAAYATTLDAQGAGTVVVIQGAGVRATLEGFTITGGEASLYGNGGGVLVHDGAQATLRYNSITGNHAQNGGAGLFISGQEGVHNEIDSNRIHDNVAEGVFMPCTQAGIQGPQQGPEPGGGTLVSGAARVVNNLVYSNSAGAGGDGMALIAWDATIQALHNTVVDNGGPSGVGVQVYGSAAELYNNLVVGHGTAISGTQATWDYNGFYEDGAAYGLGLTAGPHDVNGDPHFVARTGGDYHVGPGSAGAGRGSDAGVTMDLDGATRPAPAGSAPDLGAYEVAQRRVYLPLVLKH